MNNTTGPTKEIEFPHLSPRAMSVATEAMAREPILIRREHNLTVLKNIFLLALIFALVVDFGVGFTFNNVLNQGSDPREAQTVLDQVIRGVSSVGMIMTMMAIVSAIHIAFIRSVERPKRILASIAALLFGVGILIVASSIGNQAFGDLFGTLWNGTDVPTDIDPAQLAVVKTADAPFLLRLAGSTIFLGVGLFGAMAEIAWLTVRAKLDTVREGIAIYSPIVACHENYARQKDIFIEAQQQRNKTLDPDYRYAVARSNVARTIQVYQSAMEREIPALNPAFTSKEEWDRYESKVSRIESQLSRAEVISADSDKIEQLVRIFFPKGGIANDDTPCKFPQIY